MVFVVGEEKNKKKGPWQRNNVIMKFNDFFNEEEKLRTRDELRVNARY